MSVIELTYQKIKEDMMEKVDTIVMNISMQVLSKKRIREKESVYG